MTKLQKIVLWIVAAISVMLLAVFLSGPSKSVGGVYSEVTKYFREGLSVGTSGQFAISSTGAVTSTGTALFGSTTAGMNFYRPVVNVTADVTATAAQTGTIFQMGTAGVDVTLPASTAAAGVHYRFVVSAAVATTNMTIVASPADIFEGSLIVAGAVVDCDASDVLTFVVDGENIGDYVDVYSDGVKWMIGDSGVLTAAKLTCTG